MTLWVVVFLLTHKQYSPPQFMGLDSGRGGATEVRGSVHGDRIVPGARKHKNLLYFVCVALLFVLLQIVAR